jgi:enamine deaminase RidA (YjgF/YER057c/UK114 family)
MTQQAVMQRQGVHPPGLARPRIHCSPGIRYGPYVFVSGQMATDWTQGRPAHTRLPHLGDSVRVEVREAFRNFKAVIEAAGGTVFDVARVDNYYGNRLVTPGHLTARDEFYPIDPMEKPASTAAQIDRLPAEGCRYAVEGIVVLPEVGPRRSVVTDAVPRSPGRLPMGIQAGDFVFLSGRLAADYKQGIAMEARPLPFGWFGSPIKLQTEYILKAQRAILEAGGLSLADVVKSEVFLLDPYHITGLDEVWQEYFPKDPPARSLIVCDGLAWEGGVVEINHIARMPNSRLERRTITTPRAPAPLFYEPQAVKVGPLLFLSTQVAQDGGGLDPGARPHPEFPCIGSPGRLEGEIILRNVGALCEAAGGSLADVAKVQTVLNDLGQLDAVNEVWKRAFPSVPPAWTVVGIKGSQPIAGATMLCDVIACVPA